MADEQNKQEIKNEDKAEAKSEITSEQGASESATETDSAEKPTESAKAEEKKEIPAKFKKLVEEIEALSVLELSELVKTLEDRFGVTAAAPVAVAAAPAAGDNDGGDGDNSDEKAEVDIVLKDAGAKKIEVIKAVREISGLGLAESKALVDGAPKTIKEKVKKEEAEEAKKKLEEAGATVEIV